MDEDYSLDSWDGEINYEFEEPLYKEVLNDLNPLNSEIYRKAKEKTKEYQEDLIGLSAFPLHRATVSYTDIFHAGSEVAIYFDCGFHAVLSYGITGAVYDGLNELEDLAQKKDWNRVEEHLSKDENKIRWAFGVLNALGTGKELFLDPAPDPKDLIINNIGFYVRTAQEFGIDREEVYERLNLGEVPSKLSGDKANL